MPVSNSTLRTVVASPVEFEAVVVEDAESVVTALVVSGGLGSDELSLVTAN